MVKKQSFSQRSFFAETISKEAPFKDASAITFEKYNYPSEFDHGIRAEAEPIIAIPLITLPRTQTLVPPILRISVKPPSGKPRD